MNSGDFGGSSFASVRIEDMMVEGANFREADLSKSSLRNVTFSPETNLSDVELDEAELIQTDCSNIDFGSASAVESNFDDVNLQKSKFTEANLYSANLSGNDLSYASFRLSDLRHADLSKSNLQNTGFFRSDLSWAHLFEAKIDNIDFRSAKLTETEIDSESIESCKINIETVVKTFSRISEADEAITTQELKYNDGINVQVRIPVEESLSTGQLAQFLANLEAVYRLAHNEPNIYPYSSNLMNVEEAKSEIYEKVRTHDHLTEVNPTEDIDLRIVTMSKNSPLEITFLGLSSALMASLIISGGKIHIDTPAMKLKADLQPIGEGLESLAEGIKALSSVRGDKDTQSEDDSESKESDQDEETEHDQDNQSNDDQT
jgi:hypothetical protein